MRRQVSCTRPIGRQAGEVPQVLRRDPCRQGRAGPGGPSSKAGCRGCRAGGANTHLADARTAACARRVNAGHPRRKCPTKGSKRLGTTVPRRTAAGRPGHGHHVQMPLRPSAASAQRPRRQARTVPGVRRFGGCSRRRHCQDRRQRTTQGGVQPICGRPCSADAGTNPAHRRAAASLPLRRRAFRCRRFGRSTGGSLFRCSVGLPWCFRSFCLPFPWGRSKSPSRGTGGSGCPISLAR